jgi:hypothetical protein
MTRPTPTLAEPIVIGQWWKNRAHERSRSSFRPIRAKTLSTSAFGAAQKVDWRQRSKVLLLKRNICRDWCRRSPKPKARRANWG